MIAQEKSRFDELYARHLASMKLQGKAHKTIDAYARALRRLAHYFDRCPDNLSVEHLEQYFAALVDSHSWSTVKLDRNGIATFYRHVLKRDLPWLDIVRPPVVHSIPDILSPDEIARIIARTELMRYRTFWFVTYSLGLRLGEALNLGVGDIDSEHMRVHVRQGKGRRDRFVALPTMTLRSLRRLWASHRHPRLVFPGNPESVGVVPARVMDRSGVQRAFAQVVHDCAIHKKVSIHSLRHSYATRLVEIGLNLHGVQQLLGHASPQTTTRYLRITERTSEQQAATVNQLTNELADSLRHRARRT